MVRARAQGDARGSDAIDQHRPADLARDGRGGRPGFDHGFGKADRARPRIGAGMSEFIVYLPGSGAVVHALWRYWRRRRARAALLRMMLTHDDAVAMLRDLSRRLRDGKW